MTKELLILLQLSGVCMLKYWLYTSFPKVYHDRVLWYANQRWYCIVLMYTLENDPHRYWNVATTSWTMSTTSWCHHQHHWFTWDSATTLYTTWSSLKKNGIWPYCSHIVYVCTYWWHQFKISFMYYCIPYF